MLALPFRELPPRLAGFTYTFKQMAASRAAMEVLFACGIAGRGRLYSATEL